MVVIFFSSFVKCKCRCSVMKLHKHTHALLTLRLFPSWELKLFSQCHQGKGWWQIMDTQKTEFLSELQDIIWGWLLGGLEAGWQPGFQWHPKMCGPLSHSWWGISGLTLAPSPKYGNSWDRAMIWSDGMMGSFHGSLGLSGIQQGLVLWGDFAAAMGGSTHGEFV